MEKIQEAKQIIQEAESISLLPSPDFCDDSFPATLALFYSLKKLGKNVNLSTETLPEEFRFLARKEKLNSSGSEFLISIKEKGTTLSRLYYEKTTDGLNLYLKTSGEALKKENVAFHPLIMGDLLITVGVKKYRQVEKFLKEEPKSLINIDNRRENERYGQVNLIDENSSSFSKIISDLVFSIEENLFDNVLMEKSAHLKEVSSRIYGETDNAPSRLFSKILSKINISQTENLGWILLEKNDFQETNSCPNDLSLALKKLTAPTISFQNLLCLWEDNPHNSPLSLVRGVFYSKKEKLIHKILAHFDGARKGDGILFRAKELDLRKTKNEILKIINSSQD